MRLVAGRAAGLDLLVLDAPHLYGRPGNPYLGPDGRDWPDNYRRYGLLARVAAEIGLGRLGGWQPDLVHGHDWQAGLAPAYLAFAGEPRPATVLTIHNLAFQGLFDAACIGELGLPPEGFHYQGYESWGRVGFLKAGLYYADRLTTVSPTYAQEIQTEAEGMGLHGLLRSRRGASGRHRQRHRRHGLGPGHRPPPARRLRRATLEGRREPCQRCRSASASTPEPDALLCMRGQPADRAEGARPAAGRPADACSRTAASSPLLGSGDPVLEARLPRCRRWRIPAGSAASSATTSRSPTCFRAGPTP